MIDEIDQISKFLKHTNVSRETIERLKTYHALLKKWNPAINLVGRKTIDEIWTRHFLDSAQLWDLRPSTAIWLDFGSGAGFPGLVIAAMAAEENPEIMVELVESDARKAAFLQNTSQVLGVPVKIYPIRIENVAPHQASVITARALAPLSRIFEYSQPFIANNTVLLLQKGRRYELELTEARKYWTFEVQITPSITDPDGAILRIEGLGRA